MPERRNIKYNGKKDKAHPSRAVFTSLSETQPLEMVAINAYTCGRDGVFSRGPRPAGKLTIRKLLRLWLLLPSLAVAALDFV